MFAVIMAGGVGTRFWPASREAHPKQFLKITGERTMLEETLARARALTDDDNIYVVINADHQELANNLIGSSRVNVLAEPVGRNTAPCIGLAAIHAARRGNDQPMVIMPADHYIGDTEQFISTVQAGSEIAAVGGIVTIGIVPTRPDTGYGYIEIGTSKAEARGRAHFDVADFVEKPPLEDAIRFLKGGRHLWNSGIFVFTPATIVGEIAVHLADLRGSLERIAGVIGTERYDETLAREYQTVRSISIDHGVMEHTEAKVRVLPADFAWSDVGSWQALYELRTSECDAAGNLLLGDGITFDAKRNLVYSTGGRFVVLLGVEGMVVVDTSDALLVADLRHSQDVKKINEILGNKGRNNLR
jgi:mannose-1-phosphate guanylyltransferase